MSARAASAGSGSGLVAVGDGWRLVLAEITVGEGADDRERVLGAQVAGQARDQRDTAKVIRATGVDAAQQRQSLGQRPNDEERCVCGAGSARVRRLRTWWRCAPLGLSKTNGARPGRPGRALVQPFKRACLACIPYEGVSCLGPYRPLPGVGGGSARIGPGGGEGPGSRRRGSVCQAW